MPQEKKKSWLAEIIIAILTALAGLVVGVSM